MRNLLINFLHLKTHQFGKFFILSRSQVGMVKERGRGLDDISKKRQHTEVTKSMALRKKLSVKYIYREYWGARRG